MINQHLRLFCLTTLLIAGMLLSGAEAKPAIEPLFTPYIASSLLVDSNFLRFSDSVDAQAITGTADKSELIQQLAGGFDIDWKQGVQQLLIKANVYQNSFQNFSSLDYIGWKKSGAVELAITA